MTVIIHHSYMENGSRNVDTDVYKDVINFTINYQYNNCETTWLTLYKKDYACSIDISNVDIDDYNEIEVH